MNYRASLTILCALYAFFAGQAFSQSAALQVEHWAYPFLDRLETNGVIVSEDFNMRPFSRLAVAELLLQANEPAKLKLLSEIDQKLHAQLMGEFHEEIYQLAPETKIDSTFIERHLFTWKSEGIRAHFDGRLAQDSRYENKKAVDLGIPGSTTAWGIIARIQLHKSLSINVDGGGYVLNGVDSLANTVFSPSLGLPVTEGAFVDFTVTDNVSSTVNFKLPWFELELGRNLVAWGPGYRGNLLVSQNSNFYDLIKTTFRYKRVKYEYFHGFLNSDRAKFLMAHRLELYPLKRFRISISESVVYGERDVEPLYLNPFMPIIVSERHVGNKDNNMLALDATLFLKKNRMKIYTEILFDDFDFSENIFSAWVNKWGALAGIFWPDPFGLKNSDFRFEVVRLQPFVYSHKQSRNTYSNYNMPIGHWLGPDADDWYFEFTHKPSAQISVGVSWEQRRRGQNDITVGARPETARFKFLDGVVERSRYYGGRIQWQALRDFFLTADYHFIQSKNLHRVAGVNQNNHRLFLRASLNY